MGKIRLALGTALIAPYDARVCEVCEVTPIGQLHAGRPLTEAELAQQGRGHEIVFVGSDVVTREVLLDWQQHGLKLLGCGRGTPVNVDWKAVHELGIPLVYTPGRNAVSVAEYTFGMILGVVRRIGRSYHALQSGQYLGEERENLLDIPQRSDVVWRMPDGTSPMRLFSGGFDLCERTMGLIGFGAIGSRVAAIARGFGMEVNVYDPYCAKERIDAVGAHACTLEQTLSQADVVSIHLPVTPQTRGLVDAWWFAQMQPSAYFVNTARAAVVDQQALIDALQHKKIAGAALDVMWEEPCPQNHPLLHMDNVLITTHLGGMSQDVDKWQSAMIADEIVRYANGLPPQLVWTRTE